ncbi:MAG TPA: hypothetical protein VK929_17890 [Longimicrobiales bacterium]|nr:hypothetical protein [Longimicrobiales bacterium]
MRLGTLLAAVTAVTLTAVPVTAQTARIDEGTFRILLGGREVGMETFSIRQSGTGADAVVIAQGRVVLEQNGASEVIANVQLAGAGLRPVAYDLELRGGDARRISGSVTGRRASARIAAASETFREYLVTEGAVVLDDGVAHHYWFLAQRAAAGATTVPVMVPRESRQVQATLTAGAEESISAGGGTVRARKLTVQLDGGDSRHVWVDSESRVLRVEIPGRNLVAVRTTLP